MSKIIAVIMAIIMSLTAAIPGLFGGGTDAMTNGEWIKTIVNEFGMNPNGLDEIQIAKDWEIIDSTFDASAKVTTQFVAITLVKIARLNLTSASFKNANKFANAAEIATAVQYGIVSLQANGKFNDKVASRSACASALEKAKNLWQNLAFGDPSLDYDLSDNLAYGANSIVVDDDGNIVTDNPDRELKDYFDAIDFQGTFEPNFVASQITDENGVVLNDGVAGDPNSALVYGVEGFSLADLKNFDIKNIDYVGLLKKINLSFSVKGFKVKAKILDNGLNLSVGGAVCDGVNITKSFNLTNFNVNAKLNADILKNNIKESYLRIDYDCLDSTIIEGSYAASLAEKPYQNGEEAGKFLDRIKHGFELVKGGDTAITLFKVNVPIPNVPCITISLDVKLRIDVYGKIQIDVVSNETKGYEFVNGKIRFINDREVIEKNYFVNANAELKVILGLGIEIVGIVVIDADFIGGIGVAVNTTIYVKDDNGNTLSSKTLDLPFDLAIETTIGQNRDKVKICGNCDIYGLFSIALGMDSPLLKFLNLDKTWNIVTRANGTFYTCHLEEGGVVPACTRAA